MTTTVLAYFPSPGQGVWYLGPFPIRAYALCIIAGIIAALVIGDRRWVARGGERGVIYDIALWAVPFGLIGGRLYHVMTDWKTYFGPGGAGLAAALRIWEGGLGIWGAVALGAVGAWIGCRRKGIPLPAFGDAVAPGLVLAQAIGRLGNYFNQELYGRETTVPWGMEIFYRRDSSGVVDVHSLDGVSTGQVAAVVHPTFLYELLWNLLVFIFLIWADRKFRLGHGRLFALYVAAYCVGRFGVELMRDDTATLIAGIRINVFTSVFVFIGAVVYFLLAPKGRENPASLYGSQPLEAAEEESLADEWAEDLLSAAKGSGILAAATVAGEHESEDSEAVGDTHAEADAEKTDLIEPVEAGEPDVEVLEFVDFDEDEDAEAEVGVGEVGVGEVSEADAEAIDDEAEAEDEVVLAVVEPGEAEDQVAEAEDAEAEVVGAEVVGADVVQADVVQADFVQADVSGEEVSEGETEAVDDEAGDEIAGDEAEAEIAEDEVAGDEVAEVDEETGEDLEHVGDLEDEELVEHVVDDTAAGVNENPEEPETVAEIRDDESGTEPADEIEVEAVVDEVPEHEPEAVPEPVSAVSAPQADDPEPVVEESQPKTGLTLRRLLWGAGSRGGK